MDNNEHKQSFFSPPFGVKPSFGDAQPLRLYTDKEIRQMRQLLRQQPSNGDPPFLCGFDGCEYESDGHTCAECGLVVSHQPYEAFMMCINCSMKYEHANDAFFIARIRRGRLICERARQQQQQELQRQIIEAKEHKRNEHLYRRYRVECENRIKKVEDGQPAQWTKCGQIILTTNPHLRICEECRGQYECRSNSVKLADKADEFDKLRLAQINWRAM